MEQLSRVCKACGKERKKKGLIMYTEDTLTPYCNNPYICNDKHPNSPANLVTRHSVVELIPYETASIIMEERLKSKYADRGIYDMVAKILETPSTVRISEPEMAEFLVGIMLEYGFESKSDAIRYCIQEAMLNHKEIDMKQRQLEKAVERTEQMKETLSDLEETKQEESKEKKQELKEEVDRYEKVKLEELKKEQEKREESLQKTKEIAESLDDELIF